MENSREQIFLNKFGTEWYEVLKDFLLSDKMDEIGRKLMSSKNPIYPSKENVFRIFKEIPYSKIKVVIVGQD